MVKWYYYNLSFYYTGPTYGMPDDSEISKEAGSHLLNAETLILKAAKKHKISIRHAYMWPDGSLYKYARFRKQITVDDLRPIFNQEYKVGEEGKTSMVGISSIRLLDHTEYSKITGFELISVKDQFTIKSKKKFIEIYNARTKQREENMEAYHKARDECTVCRPGQMACDGCSVVLEVARMSEKSIVWAVA